MNKKTITFTTARKNIETDIVRNEIKLLREYARITDAAGREKFMSRFHPIMRAIVKQAEYTPDELIARLKYAIKLDKYRPRNMSLFMLAISPDLYHIHGEFDTFDLTLSQMFHGATRDDAKIRDKFNAATMNRFDLAKQMTHDWLRRTAAFPTQMAAARNAKPENAVAAYTELFNLLINEFCREYKWDQTKSEIVINLVDNADAPDYAQYNVKSMGFFTTHYEISIPDEIKKSERQKILDAFYKAPANHPLAKKVFSIVLCLSKMRPGPEQNINIPFFDIVFSSFAHEMQHILDIHIPRMGALGPQIAQINAETYVRSDTDSPEYYKTACELSAYAVTGEIIRQRAKQKS